MALVTGAADGTTRPEDLIAFIDGEAPEDVRARIAADPAMRASAAQYAQTQRRLQRNLYRFACPSPQLLGEYDLGLVSVDERTRIAAHVVMCPRCTEELRMFRDFLALQDEAPPNGAGTRVRRLVANLLSPPPLFSPHASLRGAEETTTRTYQVAGVTITLDLSAPSPHGRTSLVGLLWRDDDGFAPLIGNVTLYQANGSVVGTTEIDEMGNFAFDEIATGMYRLEVMLGDECISIEEIVIRE